MKQEQWDVVKGTYHAHSISTRPHRVNQGDAMQHLKLTAVDNVGCQMHDDDDVLMIHHSTDLYVGKLPQYCRVGILIEMYAVVVQKPAVNVPKVIEK